MRHKMLLISAFLALAVGVSGCATTLTMLSPVTSEIVVSEKRPGDFDRYTYEYQIEDNSITFYKIPVCKEVAKAVRVDRKREIGYGPAMLEMVFFGMGLLDIASANAISEASRKIYPLAEFPTGNLLVCGKRVPAAGEILLVEDEGRNFSRTEITDENGRINLKNVIGRVNRPLSLTIRLAEDASVSFSCWYRTAGNDLLSWAD